MTKTASKECSPRIAALRLDVMDRHGSWVSGGNPFLPDVAIWRAADRGRSRVQQRAAYLHELVKAAPIEIRRHWRFAGEHLVGTSINFAFASGTSDGLPERIRELGVKDDEIPLVRAVVEAWTGVSRAAPVAGSCLLGEMLQENNAGRGGWGRGQTCDVYWANGWMENHSIRDYATVLKIGFAGIRKSIESLLAAADLADADFPRRENFWRAGLSICDAGIALGRRYAEHARKLAAEAASEEEKTRLSDMADTCARVPEFGARTFFEAVQSLWLCHILTCGEDGINANSIGRLDQMLYPYYQADLRGGLLTREAAVELMEEFACKMYLDYDVQAIVLGGQDYAGQDAVNELSYIILEATRNVGFIRDVSVRLHKDSPQRFVDLASEMIAAGGGIPFLFNDDCFIKALADHGIALEDARDYAPIGCIELTIPGKANPHAVSGWFNSTKCMELALFDGRDHATGTQLGPRTGSLDQFRSFEDLFKAYQAQVQYFADRMVYHCNRGELAQRERGPQPCWSVLTDDCIMRGRDITDGGPIYNYHSICFLGTANTADSLMALRKLLFEEKRLTASEVMDALRRNFDGCENLRKLLLTQVPKYGNDVESVDAIASRIAGHFIDVMDKMRSPLNGRYFVHLFSFLCNIQFGKMVGATPDGRKAGDPLAYSLSAQQGRDEKGVTAMLNSLARLPHERAAGASAAIIEVDPSFVAGDEGVARLSQIIRTAIAMGVGQLQWNVTTVERLKQAQKDPEHYGNIPVRVAGFSQLFKLIDRELQDHIIARTKHTH